MQLQEYLWKPRSKYMSLVLKQTELNTALMPKQFFFPTLQILNLKWQSNFPMKEQPYTWIKVLGNHITLYVIPYFIV